MQNARTAATGEAVSDDASNRKAELRYPAETAMIRKLDIAELISAAGGFSMARAGFGAMINQPRCGGAAHDLMQAEAERLDWLHTMAMDELERRPFDGTDADEDRIRAIMAFETGECTADVIDTVAKATKLYGEHQRARFFREQRKAS